MGFFPQHIFLLFRRFASLAYDIFLLVSVLFLIGAVAVLINQGQAVNPQLLLPVSVVVSYVFFAWFWRHGGQTLGMRAWRIKLSDINGRDPGWIQCFIRFLLMAGLLGLGTIWVLFDRDGQALQDRVAKTILHKNPSK